jgi:hypothetical protein
MISFAPCSIVDVDLAPEFKIKLINLCMFNAK